MKAFLKKIRHSAAVLPVMLLLAAVIVYGAAQETNAAGRTIQVGYMDIGSVIQNKDGSYSGYTVEYLDKISEHTGWKYEYTLVPWNDCLEMLQNGEVDMLAMLCYTPERAEKVAFSELAMARSRTILCAMADSDIYYQDYDAIDGRTIGAIESTIYYAHLLSYIRDHDLDCPIVTFSTEEEAMAALQSGEIDLLAAQGFFNSDDTVDTKLIDDLGVTTAYFATNKDDHALMIQLNEAMQQVQTENYSLDTELTEKYTDSSKYGLCLTKEENEYLNRVGTITVYGFSGRRPMGYISNNGEFTGVLADYLNTLGSFSYLSFVHEPVSEVSFDANISALEAEGTAMLFIDQDLSELGLEGTLYKSDSLFETGLAYIRRQDDYVSKYGAHVFALTSEMSYLEPMLLETNSESSVLYYDTSTECMDAVANGLAEMTILDEHVAAYLLQRPKFEDTLVQVTGSSYYSDSMCLYVSEVNRPLVSILNKTLEYVPEQQRLNIISNAMLDHSYEYQLSDILYKHWSAVIIAFVALIAIIFLAWLLYSRIKKVKLQEQEKDDLQRQLWRDSLTGLYNRVGFYANAREMLYRLNGKANIVRVNIHRFKLVNEVHNLESGDMLLRELGSKLEQLAGQFDMIIGRFSADQFYICIAADDMEQIDFPRHISVPDLGMEIALTYGIYPVSGQVDVPLNIMCDRADLANSSASVADEGYIRWYSDEDRQLLLREQLIESEMELALEEEQFCIYIQPQYDIETEKIVGGEVLVRWLHPEKGLIPPNEFIGVFERNGFIRKLDHYVWEQCCRFIAQCRKDGLPVPPLSVNVSRVHFYGYESITLLSDLIDRYGLDPKDLELEVTESFCSEDPDMIIDKCYLLRGVGFRIAMDDFGSGYSSLNMLKEMPIDIIKMDLRFLSGDDDDDQADKGRNILGTLIRLAHTLEFEVVVEGLETRSQRDFIREIGNCSAQGYFYSRPIPAADFATLIQTEEVDDGSLYVPTAQGNARRERLIRELRTPILDMVSNSPNICAYLIPERQGILAADMAKKLGLPTTIDNFPEYLVDIGNVHPESAATWLNMFAALENGEPQSSALVSGVLGTLWVRLDAVADSAGHPVIAMLTFDDVAEQLSNDDTRAAETRMLKENIQLLKLIAQHSSRVVCYYDIKNRSARVWDEDICKRCRLPHLCQTTADQMLESGDILPESVDTLRAMFSDIERGRPNGEIRMRAKNTDGIPRWFDLQYSTICDEQGQPISALISNIDITEQYEHEMAYLRELQSITETEQSLGVMEVDLNTGIIELQDSKFVPDNSYAIGNKLVDFADYMVHLKMQEKDRAEALRFFSPEYLLHQHDDGTRLLTRVWPIQFISGQDSWARFDVELITDPYSGHIRAFFHIWDVTDITKKQLDIQRRSEQDGMTGLLNRATAEAYISAEIDLEENRGILILIDLDQLKQINDNYGHAEGDEAINIISNTLKSHFRESDIIGRIGGDEFIVYLPGAAKNSDFMYTNLTALMRKFSGMAVGDNDEWGVSCSIGYAIESEGSTYESLFNQADKALYHVKNSGRNNFAKYVPAMEEEGYTYQADKLFSLESAKKSETSEVRHLINTLTDFYQLVLSINISSNSYHLLEEIKDGVFSKLPTFGQLDNFVTLTASRIHPDDVEGFMQRLSRDALLAAGEQGAKSVQCTFRFLDLDNSYRTTEATAILYTSESGDLCDFTLVKWADDDTN